MSIKIETVDKQETAYDKQITFTYEEEDYSVQLHWDSYDGYDLTFYDIDEPDWATNWEDSNEDSLAYTLDSLTDEVIEGEVA
jgi:hypothetical protein